MLRRGLAVAIGTIVLIATTLVAGHQARQRVQRDSASPGRFAEIDGRRVHYQLLGQGDITVIMEAGQSNSSLTWCRVASEIAKHGRVFLYDRAGLGWSDPSPNPRTASVIVDELHRLLVKADVRGPYLLVGHSMGGLYAKVFATRYAEDVKGIVFVETAHEMQLERFSDKQRKAIVRYVAQLRSQLKVLALLARTGIVALSPKRIPVDPRLTDEAGAQYRAMLAKGPEMFQTMIREFAVQPESFKQVRESEIQRLNVPVTVLRRGKAEPIVPGSELDAEALQQTEQAWRALQEATAALSADSRIIEAKSSGHTIQLDEPQVVVDAVVDMLRAIRAK
jgi:pimeloyl-ACP methyl ester carboxylesterase